MSIPTFADQCLGYQILVDSKPQDEGTWDACRILLEAFLTVSAGRCYHFITQTSSAKSSTEDNKSRQRLAGIGNTRRCQGRD